MSGITQLGQYSDRFEPRSVWSPSWLEMDFSLNYFVGACHQLCRLPHSCPYGLVNSLLAPHNALTLLCPHIVDELTLATLALPCHTNEVSAAENWVAEGVMNGPLSLPCLLSPADSRVALMFRKSWNVSLWGRGVFGNSRAP